MQVHSRTLSHGRGRVVAWCDHPFELGIPIMIGESIQVVPNGGRTQADVFASRAATSQPFDPRFDVLRIHLIERTTRAEELDRETQPLLGSCQPSGGYAATFAFATRCADANAPNSAARGLAMPAPTRSSCTRSLRSSRTRSANSFSAARRSVVARRALRPSSPRHDCRQGSAGLHTTGQCHHDQHARRDASHVGADAAAVVPAVRCVPLNFPSLCCRSELNGTPLGTSV